MNLNVSCWCILLVICTVASAYTTTDNFIEVHDMNSKKMSSLERLPPLDPARHSFPTVPTVPLLPTCMKEGYFRDPFNCGKFYFCQYSNAVPVAFYCQTGLIFDTNSNYCDHPEFVQC